MHYQLLAHSIFQVNTEEYIKNHNRKPGLDIDLDGLIPNHSYTVQIGATPQQQRLQIDNFDMLPECGVFVVEFLGADQASRCILRSWDGLIWGVSHVDQ